MQKIRLKFLIYLVPNQKLWLGNGIAKRHEEAFMFIKKEKVTDFLSSSSAE